MNINKINKTEIQQVTNHSILSLLYLKKIEEIKKINQIKSFEKKKQFKHFGFLFFNFKKRNIFMTFCNSQKKKLTTITLGLEGVKSKKLRNSPVTFKRLKKKIKTRLLSFKITHLCLFFMGKKRRYKKFYKFFLKISKKIYISSLAVLKNKPHGGCRPPKKKRR